MTALLQLFNLVRGWLQWRQRLFCVLRDNGSLQFFPEKRVLIRYRAYHMAFEETEIILITGLEHQCLALTDCYNQNANV